MIAELGLAALWLAAALGFVGLLAVEMFVGRDGTVMVNEIAPRPHNSGHWTQDACAVCGRTPREVREKVEALMAPVTGVIEAMRAHADDQASQHVDGMVNVIGHSEKML